MTIQWIGGRPIRNTKTIIRQPKPSREHCCYQDCGQYAVTHLKRVNEVGSEVLIPVCDKHQSL